MIVSDGRASPDIASHEHEIAPRVFPIIDVRSLSVKQLLQETLDHPVRDVKKAPPPEGSVAIAYPGKGMPPTRRDHMEPRVPYGPDLRQQGLQLYPYIKDI